MRERVDKLKKILCEYAKYLNDGDRIEVYEDEIRLYNQNGCLVASRRIQ